MKSTSILGLLFIGVHIAWALIWFYLECKNKPKIQDMPDWRDLKPGTLVFWHGRGVVGFVLGALLRWFQGSSSTATHVSCVTTGEPGQPNRLVTAEWGGLISYALNKKWPRLNLFELRLYDPCEIKGVEESQVDMISEFINKIIGFKYGKMYYLIVFGEIIMFVSCFLFAGMSLMHAAWGNLSKSLWCSAIYLIFLVAGSGVLRYLRMNVYNSTGTCSSIMTAALKAAGIVKVPTGTMWNITPSQLECIVASLPKKDDKRA